MIRPSPARTRLARIAVAILRAPVPQLAQLAGPWSRMEVRVHRPRRSNSVTSADGRVGPGDGLKPHLRLDHFRGRPGERRLHREDRVAVRDLLPRIAFVQRFGPDNRGGLGGVPAIAAGSFFHAVDRDVLGQRQVADLLDELPGPVPDLDVLRERARRPQPGEGPLQARDEQRTARRATARRDT